VKARTEFLVEKRDGRRQGLRLSKLARSIRLALPAQRASAARAMELAVVVMAAVRGAAVERPVRTSELADAVQRLLLAAGEAEAARRHAAVGCDHWQRRRALVGMAAAPAAPPGRSALGPMHRM
jgi:transcriptional regulator NrdR family protein